MNKHVASLQHVSAFFLPPQHVFNEEDYNMFSYCTILLLTTSLMKAEKMSKHVAEFPHVCILLYLITLQLLAYVW
jgi:hypothetical protein